MFNLNCVTNLSIKSAFPLERDLIDLLIIDEASQCDISSALPLIQRSKQIVVIGDPMQLKHITNVTAYEEGEIKAALNLTENSRASYRAVSLWDYCNTLLNTTGESSVVLDNHFRCNYGIIGYSKEFSIKENLESTSISKRLQAISTWSRKELFGKMLLDLKRTRCRTSMRKKPNVV